MQNLDGRAESSPPRAPNKAARAGFPFGESLLSRDGAPFFEMASVETLPRMNDAHERSTTSGRRAASGPAADPETLIAALFAGRVADAREAVIGRLAAGISVETVMVEDLAPAARRAGELWESDQCDFVDVTHALHWLRNMMREIEPHGLERSAIAGPAILILLAPGETHEFGAEMVESFFRAAGWRTARSDASRFRTALARTGYDAVGFSLSCQRYAEALKRAIVQARAASRNPKVKILVGGSIFGDNPELAQDLGSDFCASDAESAIRLARSLSAGLEL